MKKLIKKFILLIVIIVVVQGCFAAVVVLKGFNQTGVAQEVFLAQKKAEKENRYKKMILGDSVCRQIFNPDEQMETDEYCYLASNQAITTAGSYLLMQDYIAHNRQTEQIVYLVRPHSLANNMWIDYSYQYFVIPFYNVHYVKWLEDSTCMEVEKKFGKYISQSEAVKKLLQNNPWLMKTYLNRIAQRKTNQSKIYTVEKEHVEISELSILYLKKMQEVCDANEIEFLVMPAPLAGKKEEYNWTDFEKSINEKQLKEIMSGYVDNIVYYGEENFSDGVHFEEEFLKQHREEIVEQIFD